MVIPSFTDNVRCQGFLQANPRSPDLYAQSQLKTTDWQSTRESAGEHRKRRQAETELRESEERFRRAFDSSAVGMALVGIDGRFLQVNEALCRITGYAVSELVGKSFAEITHPDDLSMSHRRLEQMLKGESSTIHFEKRYLNKNGNPLWALVASALISDKEGRPAYFVTQIQDVTERKRVEAALRQAEAKYRSIFDDAVQGIFQTTSEGKILTANLAMARIAGFASPEELIGKGADIDRHSSLHVERREEFKRLIVEKGAVAGFEYELRRDDGSNVWVSENARTINDASGRLVGYEGTLEDITERKRSEERVRQQAMLLDQARDAILVRALDQRIIYWNKGAERLYGWVAEEAIGKRADELFSTDGSARHEEANRLILEKGEWVGELSQTTRIGGKILVESRRTLLRDDLGNPKAVLIINTDVTERNKAALALAESEERFLQLAEQSGEGFWFVELNPQRVVYVSPAVEKMLGIPAARIYQDSEAWKSAIHPEDQPCVQLAWKACLTSQSPRFEAEYRVLRPDGLPRNVYASGTPIRNSAGEIVRIGGVTRDITEHKEVERQMLRAHRLESIGTLAGGVAHDLNNVLAPILMGVELLRMQYPKATEMIDAIEVSAKRGAGMVRQLLTFAKGVDGERLIIQPLHLFKEMEKIVRTTFPKNIQVRTVYGKALDTIRGDINQLHQVLLNLCVNARDAMPNGGTLALEAENVELDPVFAAAVPDAKPGRYVTLRVKDTGAGIAPEILDRIFEPFFSTKGPDKGTGLGLSTVMGIVKSHSGFIRVYSVLEQGTTFSVYLPADGSEPEAAGAVKAPEGFRGNGEIILVVDDDGIVREVARQVLTALNFNVIIAVDGADAIIQAAEKRSEVRAMLTDLHMPHMDGLTLVRAIKRILPEAGIIISSEVLDEQERHELLTLGVNAFLDKPFTQEKLVQALKTIFKK